MKLDQILPEVAKTGAGAIDIWCLPHGDQREQVDAMGIDAFGEQLAKYNVKLGVLTRYPLGALKLGDEMKVAKKLGCRMVLTGTGGPKDVAGEDAKREIKAFLEKMKPHAAAAEEAGVVIALENHMASLLATPDSIRYFTEFNTSKHLGVAFAPTTCMTGQARSPNSSRPSARTWSSSTPRNMARVPSSAAQAGRTAAVARLRRRLGLPADRCFAAEDQLSRLAGNLHAPVPARRTDPADRQRDHGGGEQVAGVS